MASNLDMVNTMQTFGGHMQIRYVGFVKKGYIDVGDGIRKRYVVVTILKYGEDFSYFGHQHPLFNTNIQKMTTSKFCHQHRKFFKPYHHFHR